MCIFMHFDINFLFFLYKKHFKFGIIDKNSNQSKKKVSKLLKFDEKYGIL